MPQRSVGFQLAAGYNDFYVSHWFVKEGESVNIFDPLVTLTHQKEDFSITYRVPKASLLKDAVVQEILYPEGTKVGAEDILAILLSDSLSDANITELQVLAAQTQVRPRNPGANVEIILKTSSFMRELLFKLVPSFRRWYFKTYPLGELLTILEATVVVLLSLVLIPHLINAIETPGAPAPSGGPFFTLLIRLASFAFVILLCLTLVAIGRFCLHHFILRRRRGRLETRSHQLPSQNEQQH